MKRLVPLLAVLVAGCVIHSINPIGTEKSQVLPKNLIGHWKMIQGLSGLDLSAKAIGPWELELSDESKKTFKLVTFDEENARAEFEVRFFTIGQATYMDVVPDELGDEVKLNSYWRMSVHPVHGIAKVITTNDEVRLNLLSYDWVKKGLKSKTVAIPYTGNLEEFILITATSPEWETFLTRYGSDTNAFPTEAAFVLKRVADKKAP